MRVVFFGSPASALPTLKKLLEAGHVVGLVVTQPDKPAGRGRRLSSSPVKAFAASRGIATFEPERIRKDEAALARIRSAAPDVNVVVAYGQIIPGPIIYLPPRHSLNVHFSLLPKYRGAAPVQRAMLAGETETGVTIIELNERMDEGDILARTITAIGSRETALELETRLAESGADLLVEILARLDSIRPEPQDAALATLASKIKPEEGRIDWAETAREVDLRVRALGGRPGTYTVLEGRRIQVHRGRPLAFGAAGRPAGEIVAVDKSGLAVACGEGTAYLIEDLQPEGKKVMPAYVFSLGARIKAGARFEGG